MDRETKPISVRLWGRYACFTRPELKVERVSYLFPTFSGMAGTLESIYWFPGLRIQVKRIHVLKMGSPISIMRNEIQDKQSHKSKNGYLLIEDSRTQRRSTILYDVDYIVEFEISTRVGRGDSARAEFLKRIEIGQCFQKPYFGCREFVADFEPALETFEVDPQLQGKTEFLGRMLHQIDYRGEKPTAIYQEMVVENGAIVLLEPPYTREKTVTGYDSLLKVLTDMRPQFSIPTGYQKQPFTHRIELDASGQMVGGKPIPIAEGKQKAGAIPSPYILKFMAGNTLPPRLLNESSKVVYCQPEYLDMLRLAYEETQNPGILAVIQHVEKAGKTIPEGIKPGEGVAFSYEGEYITDAPELKQFWQRYLENLTKDYPIGTCAITGHRGKISMKYPVRVKGVPGANAYGASLFSADKPSFSWHGRTSNEVCQISEEVARNSVESLNEILADRKRTLRDSSGIAISIWGDSEFEISDLIAGDYNEEAAWERMQRLWRGGYPKESPNQVNMLVLAGAAGRVSVVQWVCQKESQVLGNIGLWLKRQQVHRPQSVYALANCTLSPGNEKARQKLLLAFVRNALFGDSLPVQILSNAIQRIEAEKAIPVARCAVLGLFVHQLIGKTMQQIEETKPGESRLSDREQFYLKLGKFFGYCAAIEALVKGGGKPKSWGTTDAASSLNIAVLPSNFPRIIEKSAHWYSEGIRHLPPAVKPNLENLFRWQGLLEITEGVEQGYDLRIRHSSPEHTLFLLGFRSTCWKNGGVKKADTENNEGENHDSSNSNS